MGSTKMLAATDKWRNTITSHGQARVDVYTCQQRPKVVASTY